MPRHKDEVGLVMKYFVLKPRGKTYHAKASQLAMITYAEAIKPYDKQLSADLMRWVAEETRRNERKRNPAETL
jgi:hypothetical protein